MKNRTLPFAFTITLCLALIILQPLTAAVAEQTQILPLSYYSDAKLTIKNRTVTLSGLSKGRVYFKLRTAVYKGDSSFPDFIDVHSAPWGVIQNQAFSYTYSKSAQIPNGIYELGCHYSTAENPTKTSYFTKIAKVYVQIDDNGITFLQTEAAKLYKLIHAQSKKDQAYLDFCLKSTTTVQSDDPQIIKCAQSITQGLNDDYAKAKAIYDFVSGYIYYDHDLFHTSGDYYETRSALSTLEKGRSTCGGYSALTAALLRASGIPARTVWGTPIVYAPEESGYYNHVWTEAFIEGRWVIMDSTKASPNSYTDGKYTPSTPGEKSISDAFFDITAELYSYTARIDYVMESYISKELQSKTVLPLSGYNDSKLYIGGNTIAVTGLPEGRAKIEIYKALSQTGQTRKNVFDMRTIPVEYTSIKYDFYDMKDFEPGMYILYGYHSAATKAPTDEATGAANWNSPEVRLSEFMRTYIWIDEQGIKLAPAEYLAGNIDIFSKTRQDEAYLAYYTKPSEQIQSGSDSIVAQAKELVMGCDSDYSKAKAIHDWVADNIWYDNGNTAGNDLSALGAYQAGISNTTGFSNLTAALLRAVGIPARVVHGKFNQSDLLSVPAEVKNSFRWVEAFVDGRWIIIDAKADTCNIYKNGQKQPRNYANGHFRDKYFDPTLEHFSYSHKLIGEVEIYNPRE